MKIIKMTAENFKRLVAVEIEPKGNMVMITGQNGEGKTSVLDVITAALCGKKGMPTTPIHKDGDKAVLTLDLDTMTVKKVFTKKGSPRLEITNKDGFAAKSPQKMLDELVGEISFDPMAFKNMDAKLQRTMLMELVGLDFSDLDEKIELAKAERSSLNKQKDTAQHQADSIVLPENCPTEQVSTAELFDELNKAFAHNEDVNAYNRKAELTSEKLGNIDADIERLELELENARQEKINVAKAFAQLDNPGDPIDPTAIQEKISEINEKNQFASSAKLKANLIKEVNEYGEKWSRLGTKMKEYEAEKAKRLAEVKMPIDGLGINERYVTFDGIPMPDVNDAKALEIGIAISMALNPKLKVIRMNGNDCDSKTLKAIEKVAKDNDYQVWIEKIDESGKTGIVIEDGQIKENVEQPEA